MEAPQIILWACALAALVMSLQWRPRLRLTNWTAGALFLAYAASEAGFPFELFGYLDAVVITVIMLKPEHCSFNYEAGWLYELKCMVLERSPSDRLILLCYPFAWYFYTAGIHPHFQWWGLFWIAVIQFLAAGWEPLSKSLRRHAEAAESEPEYPGTLLVASGGRLGW